MRVKCLAQKYNTTSPARAQTRTTRSGDKRTNHEGTAPSTYTAMKRYKKIVLRIISSSSMFLHVYFLKIALQHERNWNNNVKEGSRGVGANVLVMSQLIVLLSPAQRKQKDQKNP